MKISKNSLFVLLLSTFGLKAQQAKTEEVKNAMAFPNHGNNGKNILFIFADDLKPLINAYGYPQMHTPNMDRLIKSGVMFANAEVQQAVCGPSRASVMTGVYPDRTHVWDLRTDFRESSPTLVSMPEYLITQGYETSAIGKIYHKGSSAQGHDGKSWSIPHFQPTNYDPKYGAPALEYYQNPETKALIKKYMDEAAAQGKKPGQQRNYAFKFIKPSTESADVSDEAYQDGVYTKKALEMLNKLSKGGKPFMLAVGYQKPHLPFIAPKKYWDLYDRNKIELAYQELIKGAPDFAFHDSGELNAFSDITQKAAAGKPIPAEKQKELIHGYMACVSYVDAQVGKLLDELDRLKLTDKTIIVLAGDHGYHLGDHTLWNKHTNFEQAARTTFVFSGPGVAKGKKVDNPVEFLDLFPTLFDLTGVKQIPQTDGKSLVPLLDNDPKTTVKVDFAMSQFPRQNGKLMGYSIRTERYRYTEWLGNNYTSNDAYNDSNVVANELYDYQTDPQEKVNHVKEASYKAIADELHNKLKNKLNALHEKDKLTPIVAFTKKGGGEGGDEEGGGASEGKKGGKNGEGKKGEGKNGAGKNGGAKRQIKETI